MIIDKLDKKTKTIAAELEGWEKFAQEEGWLNPPDDYILYLPDPKVKIPGDTLTWEFHSKNFHKAIEGIDFKGKKVLDIAAGRTWTSKELALRGGIVTATDILRRDGIGLETAYRYFKAFDISYELVLCDMNNLPFPKGFDSVFCHASAHHSEDLQRAISEMRRVCKDGGLIIMSAEPVGAVYSKLINKLRIKGLSYGINETTPKLADYLRQFDRKSVEIIIGEDGGWRSLIKNKLLKKVVFRICGGTVILRCRNG